MTREEHISNLETIGCDGWTVTTEAYKSLQFAIKVLEQEPCEDAVSRAELEKCFTVDMTNLSIAECLALIIKRVKALPSVQPKPKTGHWILAYEQNKEDVENDNYRFICSECQCSDIHAKGTKVPYCWNCGVKMESEG